MKIHHLNLCTLCPFAGRLVSGGRGPILAAAELVIHALLVEAASGLVLVDAGMGLDDLKDPYARLGAGFMTGFRPRLRVADTAVRQVEALGFSPKDVRDVVLTHLDVDHAGGVSDFPDAAIHVFRREREAALARVSLRERVRYRPAHAFPEARWELHDTGGERWFGFDSVRAVADDVLLIPLPGHTRGHSAVAVRAPAGSPVEWLLHGGDAYFFHREMETPPRCPPALRLFQRAVAVDDDLRLANAARLRDLARDHGDRVAVFSAHCPRDFEEARARSATKHAPPAAAE